MKIGTALYVINMKRHLRIYGTAKDTKSLLITEINKNTNNKKYIWNMECKLQYIINSWFMSQLQRICRKWESGVASNKSKKLFEKIILKNILIETLG